MNYKITNLKERPDLFEKQDQIGSEAWPEFMLQDEIAHKYWMDFIEAYADLQILIISDDGKDEIYAIINTIPLYFDQPLDKLPDEGWDWGVEKGVLDYKNKLKPNYLMGIQVIINKKYQGKGLSGVAVDEMLNYSKAKGFNNLIIPIRPSLKEKYPLISTKEYIGWQNDRGELFDPWLRAHQRKGAKIVSVCSKAMRITGTKEDWENWTGVIFKTSGDYIIPGALLPINYNEKKDLGIYIEPNVWIVHEIT